jgi:hypothetical protein
MSISRVLLPSSCLSICSCFDRFVPTSRIFVGVVYYYVPPCVQGNNVMHVNCLSYCSTTCKCKMKGKYKNARELRREQRVIVLNKCFAVNVMAFNTV